MDRSMYKGKVDQLKNSLVQIPNILVTQVSKSDFFF